MPAGLRHTMQTRRRAVDIAAPFNTRFKTRLERAVTQAIMNPSRALPTLRRAVIAATRELRCQGFDDERIHALFERLVEDVARARCHVDRLAAAALGGALGQDQRVGRAGARRRVSFAWRSARGGSSAARTGTLPRAARERRRCFALRSDGDAAFRSTASSPCLRQWLQRPSLQAPSPSSRNKPCRSFSRNKPRRWFWRGTLIPARALIPARHAS